MSDRRPLGPQNRAGSANRNRAGRRLGPLLSLSPVRERFLIASLSPRPDNNQSRIPREAVMSETSVSLLERRREPADDAAWKRMVDLYAPLIHGWLRRHDVRAEDAEDLAQEVLGTAHRELTRFEHNRRPGAFRCWLRTITVNRL